MVEKLNDLDGKEWVKHTKSWFIQRGKARKGDTINHPAKFPEELATRFIEFFTKENESVFDPFMGVGSTAVAAEALNRGCYGIEISEEFAKVAKERTHSEIIIGDSRNPQFYLEDNVDFILTSPPYWNILKKKRGNSKSQHSDRADKNLKLYYSDDENDLGNIDDYKEFMIELGKVFLNCYKVLRNNKYMVVVIQNFRNSDGKYIPLAWDLAKVIKKCGFTFEGEQLWCQDDKQLGIWGYPTKFISNVHHHYCLVFRKVVEERK